MRKILLAGAAVVAIASPAVASPTYVDSQFKGVFVGLGSAPFGAIANNFTFTPAPGGRVVGNGTGDLDGLTDGTTFTLLPFTLQSGASFGFTLAGLGSFSGTVIGAPDINCPTGGFNCSVSASIAGDFTPLVGDAITDALATFTASQTRARLGVSTSLVNNEFTFAMSRLDGGGGGDTSVPVPAALSLFGFGLLGLATTRRRPAA